MTIKNLFFLMAALSLVAGCSPKNRPEDRPVPFNAKGDLTGTEGPVANWFTKSPALEKAEGTQADRAYAELGLSVDLTPVVVAVIDSGVDVNHEDLQGQIWVNPGEVPNNGVDDDHNGYVDDVNGWNFLGSYDADHKPVNINGTTLEVTRELVLMKKLKAELEAQGLTLSEAQAKYLAQLDKEVTEGLKEAKEQLEFVSAQYEIIKTNYELLQALVNVELKDLTVKHLDVLSALDAPLLAAKNAILEALKATGSTTVSRVLRLLDRYESMIKYYFNENFDPRKEIIGDDPTDMSDHNYGNNDVLGGDANHGTHVAGIIGALRNNNLGISGIATNVKIMVLRTVPNGDEYDKDVANAIRYAADNGAKIASMSFGKAYSPLKHGVDEAFRYAAAKGMLIVHAAGNDSMDTDVIPHYPNRYLINSAGGEITTWLDVGASGDQKGPKLPAVFTNYGQVSVDVFAPGVALKSTVVGQKYDTYSGTSMATPCVSGVAALVWAQHPKLSAMELKAILKNSARTHAELLVNLPGSPAENPVLVLFRKMSQTGGIVDALEALKLAVVHSK